MTQEANGGARNSTAYAFPGVPDRPNRIEFIQRRIVWGCRTGAFPLPAGKVDRAEGGAVYRAPARAYIVVVMQGCFEEEAFDSEFVANRDRHCVGRTTKRGGVRACSLPSFDVTGADGDTGAAAARSSAVARPIPRRPPQMMALLPVKSIFITVFGCSKPTEC